MRTISVYSRQHGQWALYRVFDRVPIDLSADDVLRRYGIGKHLRVIERSWFGNETVIQEGR